ncbi:MAG: hypothetical protein MUC38_10205 [Cyclobacteriaceae bacterium]|jgi:tetratricopeptide (TPR) repeat protein|nr:hypothetical protein [Cyclobacteriaceae bacterium]
MKTLFVTFLLFVALVAQAHDKKFEEAMAKQIQHVYTAEKTEALQAATHALDRIAQAEKSRWEPLYYAAFGYVMMANREPEAAKKDGYLDQAMERIRKAAEASPNNSEITALEGFAHMIRVTVDPATRGQQYSALSMQAYGKAIQQDPGNPRALALMAQMQYGMAQFFKSSTAEACTMAQKALALFEGAKSESPLTPAWGRGMTEGLLAQCQ